MDAGGINWGLINIVGPLLLVAVLLWAVLRNRKSTPRENERTEDATRSLYDEEEAARDKEETGRGKDDKDL